MSKLNSQSGFGVLGLVLVMVVILGVGGGGGYMYLKSLDKAPVGESQELADFPGSDTVSEDTGALPSGEESDQTAPEPQGGGFLGGLFSGEKDCGSIDMSGYLKDPLNYKPEVFACYGQALYDCSPAKMMMAKYEYKVEGKSGTNCVVSDSGAYDGIKKADRGPLSCSFSLGAPLAIPQPSTTKDDAFYKNVWRTISGATIFEGVNKILPTEFSATCTLK